MLQPETACLSCMIIHHEQAAFESRKVVALIFSHMLRKFAPTAEFVERRPRIMERLVQGYSNAEIALTCGGMLRECLQKEPLCMQVARSEVMLQQLVDAVQLPNFDVATDAFSSFREVLTLHKTAQFAEWMFASYTPLFAHFAKLHRCENYVTRRLSMKLVGEILLDRNNFNVMSRYIEDRDHLRTVMKALADPSQAIAFEAFHVFKIFAANPKKTPEIKEILLRNQAKLCEFLPTFQDERGKPEEAPPSPPFPSFVSQCLFAPHRRSPPAAPPSFVRPAACGLCADRARALADDEQFNREREMVIQSIAQLAPEPAAAASEEAAAAAAGGGGGA
jgi:calcium binding protein 39